MSGLVVANKEHSLRISRHPKTSGGSDRLGGTVFPSNMTSFFRRAAARPEDAGGAAGRRSAACDASSSRPGPSDGGDDAEDSIALIESILASRTHYDALGLGGSSKHDAAALSEPNLRRLYLKRSRLVHPDRHGNSQKATEAFQRLATAYETLKDPTKRRRYDLGERSAPTDASETFSSALSQLLDDFLTGNFETLLSALDLLRRTNPELNISRESAHAFLTRLRTYLLSSQHAWELCRNELWKLAELQGKLSELSYFDLQGRAKVATALTRTLVGIPLKMREAWDKPGEPKSPTASGAPPAPAVPTSPTSSTTPAFMGSSFWTLLALIDRSCQNVDWMLNENPWEVLRGVAGAGRAKWWSWGRVAGVTAG